MAQRLLVLQQLPQHLAERGDPPVCRRAHQRALRPGVQQDAFAVGVAFNVVGIKQSRGRPPADLGGELPSEVDRVEQAGVQPWPAGGQVNVGRIACQQDAPVAVPRSLAAGVCEPGDPSCPGDRQVPPVHPANAGAKFVQRHRGIPVQFGRVRLSGDDAVEALSEGNEGDPDIGDLIRRQVSFKSYVAEAQQDGGGKPREIDSNLPANGARGSVTAD
jgi:hypothetical protein